MTASIHKLSAGDGYTYLTRQVATLDATERGHKSLGDYYTEKGERPGVWLGSGLASLPGMNAGDRVTEEHMAALFGLGKNPLADQMERDLIHAGASVKDALKATQLGSVYMQPTAKSTFLQALTEAYKEHNKAQGLPGRAEIAEDVRSEIRTRLALADFKVAYGRDPLARAEMVDHVEQLMQRPKAAVAGYDITFSPVKSVSALWALADREFASQIAAAHDAAVKDALEYMEKHVLYARRGARGVRQVQVTGLIAATFVHRDSRAGDPDLHTHVAISNKVQDPTDGAWVSIDGTAIYQGVVSISERYNSAMEARLTELGLTFEDRERPGRRPVREVVGVPDELLAAWSSRRSMIDDRRAELAAEFEATHGRPPRARELYKLAQQANLDTREAKHEPRSEAQQRGVWEQAGQRILGTWGVQMMIRTVRKQRDRDVKEIKIDELAASILSTVTENRARFSVSHVRSEADRTLRSMGHAAPSAALVERIAGAAMEHADAIRCTRGDPAPPPAAAQLWDGSSQWAPARKYLYTTSQVLAAEQTLLEIADRDDGPRLSSLEVGVALLESTANGIELNAGQTQLVHSFAESGARLQLVLAPAGSGKTTALRVLSRAWAASGRTTIGFAPSAVAAEGLAESIGVDAYTLAALVKGLQEKGPQSLSTWESRVQPGTLVLIDEAGMAGTRELAMVTEWVIGRGGNVRLVGDDQQLAAIAAGGVLRNLQERGDALTLTELMRFTDQATGELDVAHATATLALRAGDTSALGYLLDNGRVHTTAADTIADQVIAAWRTDCDRNLQSIMLASTRAMVTELNQRVQAERVAATRAAAQASQKSTRRRFGRDRKTPPETTVTLRDSGWAGVGDTIVARKNRYDMRITATKALKNGDRFVVTEVRDNGSLTGRHLGTGRLVRLPDWYVKEHVDLGWAVTAHGAQGITVDTAHGIVDGTETRQLLYVLLSRARFASHLYLAPVDPDTDAGIAQDQLRPKTTVQILEEILSHDGTELSALSELLLDASPAHTITQWAGARPDMVALAAIVGLGPEKMTELRDAADEVLEGVSDQPAWDALQGVLAQLEYAAPGTAIDAFRDAVESRPLGDARDLAAVLHYRMTDSAGGGPLPWLSDVPQGITSTPEWGGYITAVDTGLHTAVQDLRAHYMSVDTADLPQWAMPYDQNRLLVADLAVWRAAFQIPDTDLSPTGPNNLTTRAATNYQDKLLERANNTSADVTTSGYGALWRDQVTAIDTRVVDDPWWPILARRLDLAAHAHLDVASLLETHLTAPLPTSHPASALWYRLAPALSPAAVADFGAPVRLRPAWTDELLSALDEKTGPRVIRDAQWPVLVAAVDQAARRGLDPARLLRDAVALTNDVDTAGRAAVLAWTVTSFTRPAPERGLTEADLYDPDREAWRASLTEADLFDADREAWTAPSEEWPAPEDDLPPDDIYVAPSTSRSRMVELNALAANFWSSAYLDTPAADYVTGRFGTTLTQTTTIGYAPATWTALVDHLHEQGASDAELVDAGLATYGPRGLRDVFVNRIMLALRDPKDNAVVGFIGRADPSDTRVKAKYMNTASGDENPTAFRKGDILYGVAENTDALRAGATPVICEGVFDALAVTLAGDGNFVGVAPCGTALTVNQIRQLRTISPSSEVIVATDTDSRGQAAALKDYWLLADAGLAARRIVLQPGIKDPAEQWAADPNWLRQSLAATKDLAPTLTSTVIATQIASVDQRLAEHNLMLMVDVARTAGRTIAAAPTLTWADEVTTATHLLAATDPDADPDWLTDVITNAVLAEAISWQPTDLDVDPARIDQARRTAALQRISQLRQQLGESDKPSAPNTLLADRLAELQRTLTEETSPELDNHLQDPYDAQRDDLAHDREP